MLRPPPSIPDSLIDPLTGEMFTKNDVDTSDSDLSSDSSFYSSVENENDDDTHGKDADKITELTLETAPSGTCAELELAMSRVLERQKQQIRAKYNT